MDYLKNDSHHVITTETNETIKVLNENVKKVEDRFNDFMKNVLDKRQLSKKIVANSLYGQCGAKTSSFYEHQLNDIYSINLALQQLEENFYIMVKI